MSIDNLLIRNIFIFCLMHTGNQADAKKLVKDAIASAIQSGQVSPGQPSNDNGNIFAPIFPFLLQNIDRFRKDHRDYLIVESPISLFSASIEHDWPSELGSSWEVFFQTVQFLPHRQQTVIVLRLFCGLDRFSIAYLLSETPREVTSQLITGLQELRYRLEDPSSEIPNSVLSDDQIDAFDSYLAEQDSSHGDLWIEEAALAGSILQLAKAIRIDPTFQNELSKQLQPQITNHQPTHTPVRQKVWLGFIVTGGIAALIFIVGIGAFWARQALLSTTDPKTVTQPTLSPTQLTGTNVRPETTGQTEITSEINGVPISSTGAPLSDLPSSAQITLDTAFPPTPGSLPGYSYSPTPITDGLIQSYREKFSDNAQLYRLRSGGDQTDKFLLVNGKKWILITPSTGSLMTNSIGTALEVTDQTISQIPSDRVPFDWTLPSEQSEIRLLTYQPVSVTPVAGRPIRTAENAWEAVQKRDESAWIRFSDQKSIWTGASWERTIKPGEQFDVYGKIEVYDPNSSGNSPLILLNSLFVEGDPGGFRSQAQTGQMIHAWGTVREVDSDHPATLILKGFEGSPLPYTEISGVIVRQKDKVQFTANDGTLYNLGDVPSEVPDGLACTLAGVVMGSTQKVFNWIRIVSDPDPSTTPEMISLAWFSEHSLSIDRIRLVYSSGRFASANQTTAETVIMNPFWEFSGHSSDGNLFTILISAYQQ